QIDRQYLAALFAEDDRIRAETEEFLAKRRGQASPPVRETGPGGVLHRDYNGGAPAASAVPATLCFDDDGAAFILPFTEEQADAIGEAIGRAIEQSAQELRAEAERGIERLEQKLLQTVVRMVMPGEIAEQKVYSLNDRLSLMERYVERAT